MKLSHSRASSALFPCLTRLGGLSLVLAATAIGCAAGESNDAPYVKPSLDAAADGDGAASDASTDVEQPDGDAAQAETGEDALPDVEPDATSDAPDDVGLDAEAEAGCATGTKDCAGQCVDEDDPDFGCTPTGCDPCDLANATAACSNGACAVDVCDANFADCDSLPANGCEVELTTDLDHCGMCGHGCDVPNGTPGCDNGVCSIVDCDTGFADCDPSVLNGCEANTQLDPSHCGSCGNLCLPVGGSACANGVCQTTSCNPGTGDCDGVPDNGCEVDLTSTLAHCGFCGGACSLPHATPACIASKCEIQSCDVGYDDCDGVASSGCEQDLTTSGANCGACNAPCSTLNNTSRACATGLCSYVCNSGFADCNGPQPGATDDGCETVTSADVNNCGTCGLACTNANGSTQCSNGVCAPSCNTGYGDCNGTPNDGCETGTSSDATHCGSCTTQCLAVHGTNPCVGGACTPSCSTGWANCNANPVDGCETGISNDVTHCGSCTTQCQAIHGTTACVNGACTPTCATGWGDCDGDPSNGCETDLTISPANCGTCGKSCAAQNAQTTCSNSTCAIVACSPYYFDNDTNPATGCEYKCDYLVPSTETCDGTDQDCDGSIDETFDFQNDPNHCGNCTTTCGTTTGGLCCAGTCRNSDPNNCGACSRTCTSGMLVINELMIDPEIGSTDAQGEWFEIYNPNTYEIDLRGFVIRDNGSDSHTITSALPVIVAPYGYIVLGNNANQSTNGGVDEAYQYAGMSLGNSGDELLILGHGVLLDQVVWTTSPSFDVSGKSKELSVNHRNAAANDTLTNWCTAVSVYGGGDYGTPGVANDCSL